MLKKAAIYCILFRGTTEEINLKSVEDSAEHKEDDHDVQSTKY